MSLMWLIIRIDHLKDIQRPTTLALAPPQTFPVNPQKKHKIVLI